MLTYSSFCCGCKCFAAGRLDEGFLAELFTIGWRHTSLKFPVIAPGKGLNLEHCCGCAVIKYTSVLIRGCGFEWFCSCGDLQRFLRRRGFVKICCTKVCVKMHLPITVKFCWSEICADLYCCRSAFLQISKDLLEYRSASLQLPTVLYLQTRADLHYHRLALFCKSSEPQRCLQLGSLLILNTMNLRRSLP